MRDHKPLTIRQYRVRKLATIGATFVGVGVCSCFISLVLWHPFFADDSAVTKEVVPEVAGAVEMIVLIALSMGIVVILTCSLDSLEGLERFQLGDLGELYQYIKTDDMAMNLLSRWVGQGYVIRQRDDKYLRRLSKKNQDEAADAWRDQLDQIKRERNAKADAEAEKALGVCGIRNDSESSAR